jgi:hypothetical protein
MHEKSSLHTKIASDAPYREVLVYPTTASSYDGALKYLQTFAFTDFYVDPDGIAHTKVGNSGLQRVLVEFVNEVRHSYLLVSRWCGLDALAVVRD